MSKSGKKEIALYFGTFNPIHVGHLVIANYITQLNEVDEVWLIVSPQNPLKKKASMLADYHRLAMVREAISDNAHLHASDIEFSLPQPSYTIDTLTYISEKYPQHSFSLVIGEDNLKSFPKWKNHDIILKNFKIWVYPRTSTQYDRENKSSIEIVDALYKHSNVNFLDEVPMMAVSSSFIRKQLREKKDPSYLLTPSVLKYIKEMHFYEK